MLSKLRNYSKIIIIIVAIAMVASGALYGALYGFNSRQSSSNNAQSSNIAEVNDTNITQQEYYSVLRSQAGMTNLTRAQEIPFKYNVLRSIIDRNLILQQADELGIKSAVTEEDLNDYLNQILEENEMTEEELSSYLDENNNSLKEFKDQLRENLKLNNRIQQVEEQSYSNITVSEDEIINLYEKAQVQLIVKRFADDKDAAKSEITDALNKIQNGSEFTEVAEEYTDFNRIDLGMINRENSILSDEVMTKVFDLEQDSISDIIEDNDAFYLIKVLDKKLASGEDYENEKKDIQASILEQKQNEAFSNWLQNVRAESTIMINDSVLNGYKALSNDNYSLAVSELEKAIEEYSTPMTYVYLAEAYQGNGQQDKAIATFDKAIEEYPSDWELHFNYANSLMMESESNLEKIMDLLDKSSTLADENLMAHYQIYMAYSQLGDEEKAQSEIQKMTELQNNMQEQQNTENEQSSETSEDTADDNNGVDSEE